jgi:hypothetical protein
MSAISLQPPQDQMLANHGQQARELHQLHAGLPALVASAPPVQSEGDNDRQIRWKVVCISAVLAVCLVIQALLQYIFDMVAMQDALEQVREVTHMRGGPSAVAMLLNAVPSVFMSVSIGLLVPLCGYLGVKQANKWLMGCFCGCNAFHCCTGIISMVTLLIISLTIQAVTPQVELFLAKCDPMQCSNMANTTDQAHFIDCLASGEWKEYKPRFSGPRFSSECPPIFMHCDNQPDFSLEAHSHKATGSRIGGFPVRAPPQQVQPPDTFADADAPVRAAGMGDYGAFLSSEVPMSTRQASGPHQGLRRLRFAWHKKETHPMVGFFKGGHAPDFNTPPMPKDPIAECQLNQQVVDRFHQIRLLAPELLPKLELFLLLRVALMLPVVILGCLGFCWGKDLWSSLNAGYNPVSRSQEMRPQVMLNPALGISASAPMDQNTQISMSQPLILSAPPVPPAQVTAISPPSHYNNGQPGSEVQPASRP